MQCCLSSSCEARSVVSQMFVFVGKHTIICISMKQSIWNSWRGYVVCNVAKNVLGVAKCFFFLFELYISSLFKKVAHIFSFLKIYRIYSSYWIFCWTLHFLALSCCSSRFWWWIRLVLMDLIMKDHLEYCQQTSDLSANVLF